MKDEQNINLKFGIFVGMNKLSRERESVEQRKLTLLLLPYLYILKVPTLFSYYRLKSTLFSLMISKVFFHKSVWCLNYE